MVNQTDLRNVESELGKRSLIDFTKMAWPEIESRGLTWNLHMDAMAEHLEAVSRGDIRKIIINIPPRHTKSIMCNVAWPAWDWIKNPARAFLFSTYRVSLSERDNKKANQLVSSDWYQKRFEPRINPKNDTNMKDMIWALLVL